MSRPPTPTLRKLPQRRRLRPPTTPTIHTTLTHLPTSPPESVTPIPPPLSPTSDQDADPPNTSDPSPPPCHPIPDPTDHHYANPQEPQATCSHHAPPQTPHHDSACQTTSPKPPMKKNNTHTHYYTPHINATPKIPKNARGGVQSCWERRRGPPTWGSAARRGRSIALSRTSLVRFHVRPIRSGAVPCRSARPRSFNFWAFGHGNGRVHVGPGRAGGYVTAAIAAGPRPPGRPRPRERQRRSRTPRQPPKLQGPCPRV